MIKKLILLYIIALLPLYTAAEERFIKIHKSGRTYKFEIPDELLGKDILFGSRIVDLSSPSAKVYAAGQMRRPPVMIRFAKRDKLIVIEEISNVVEVSEEDPIFNAFEKNSKVGGVNFFEIESRNEERNSSVIDVTKYFSEEVSLAWPLPDNVKKGRLESRLSRIEFMKEFKEHINVRSYYEFLGGKETFTITVQYFMLLLPREPLMPRFNDDRVGYQPFNLKRYNSGKSITTSRYISRWRVTPAKSDLERHKNGEMVEPQQKLVFYIEPYFPKDWIPYIKKGVEDWNRAFEKIGFKNVLEAKNFPDDPEFDPYDIKNFVIRYIPLEEANAAGQIWTDPRSGEIINGEVLWWNNVVNLITMWRFTQTAAVDPQARGLEYDIETMGPMIRYAIAHEIGHVLGLQHNMRSSYAYPADSLRSPTFTAKYGTTASIMDYARNNHIARPGDLERGVKMTPPILGPYDYLSIEYGYKYIHEAETPGDEYRVLDSLFRSKGSNPMYLFAPFIASPISPDPSAQSESLSDNVLISSLNGIENTRIILDSLVTWTLSAGGGAREIEARYDALSRQYFRYITLSLSYIGGTYVYQGPIGDSHVKYVPIEKSKQKEALRFAVKQLREAPEYLDRGDLSPLLGSLTDGVLKRQSEIISSMLNNFILPRVLSNSSYSQNNFYSLEEYLSNLDDAVWEGKGAASLYDKNLQITYIQTLKNISTLPKQSDSAVSGISALIVEAGFKQLVKTEKRLLKLARSGRSDRDHYQFLLKIIDINNQ